MWAADNIAHANMLFYPLYYDIISLTSLKITQAFYLLLGFAENQIVFWDFKVKIRVYIYIYNFIYIIIYIYMHKL